MFSSLRFTILIAMLAVAAVAITTITVVAAMTTRAEFARYVAYGRELREEQTTQIVLTYWEDELIEAQTVSEPPVVDAEGNYLTGSDSSILYFNSESMRVFPVRRGTSNDFIITDDPTVAEIQFVTGPDGSTQIMNAGQPVGRFSVEPSNDITLMSAQINFMQSVNWGLLLAGGLAGLAAVVLTFVLSRRIVHPVAELTNAARELENGDLSQRVNAPLHGEIGKLAHAFNAMAETLSRTETARRNMVSDVAHELRSPLTNIRGYLEAIQDGILQPDRALIDLIYEEAILLNNIVQDLQELALAEAGQLRFTRREVQIEEIIEQTVALLQPTAQTQHIDLSYHIPYRLPPVYADPHRFSQVLRNLLTNAVKYTPAGGSVTVTAAAHMKEVEIRVTDTGSGIDAEHIPYLFERFYRADPSRSRITGGAGLGLAIARQFVEGMGGNIRVESEIGQGTTFTFTVQKYLHYHRDISPLKSQDTPVIQAMT